MKKAPKCQACRIHDKKTKRAAGLYGWNTDAGYLVKSNLCHDHARVLRVARANQVVVLRSYR